MQPNHHSTLYYFQHAPVSRAIAHFGVPSMVTMLVAILYNLVDTAFVGMLGDVNALAAVSLAMPVLLVTNGVGQVFGIGCASYISRLLGRGEYRRVKQVSALALYGAAIAGAAVIALCFLFLGPILQILGTSANTLTPTRQYFTVLLAGGPASMLSFALSMVIRAAGDAKAAMKGNLIGTAVNIALDPLFIFALGMGVRGAAVATVLGNACALAFYLRHIGAKSGFLSISPAHFRSDRAMLRAVFSIGLPSLLTKGVYVAGFLVQNNAAAAFGDVYVAALGLVFKITMMPKQLCMGLCMGVQQPIGEGNNRDPRNSGTYDYQTATASVYVQRADGILTGHVIGAWQLHLTVIHEIGHAYFQMLTSKYGQDRLVSEWTKLNNGYNYNSPYAGREIDLATYITSYAKTSMEEDFCETLSMVYADRTHYHFQDYNYIDENGVPSGIMGAIMLPPSTSSPLYKKGQMIHALTKSYIGEDCVATRNAARFLTLVQ